MSRNLGLEYEHIQLHMKWCYFLQYKSTNHKNHFLNLMTRTFKACRPILSADNQRSPVICFMPFPMGNTPSAPSPSAWQDLPRAVDLFRRAAEQNHAGAMCNLGVLHTQAMAARSLMLMVSRYALFVNALLQGLGVEKDEERAKSFYAGWPSGKRMRVPVLGTDTSSFLWYEYVCVYYLYSLYIDYMCIYRVYYLYSIIYIYMCIYMYVYTNIRALCCCCCNCVHLHKHNLNIPVHGTHPINKLLPTKPGWVWRNSHHRQAVISFIFLNIVSTLPVTKIDTSHAVPLFEAKEKQPCCKYVQ